MRLSVVRLKNLNSLLGDGHEVRFDAPPLAQAGVFLITGPTGAGKSTLLDAVTLALYGRAARYGSDRPDEMMSRHTGDCLAEVEFETRGRKLRATWRLRRARGKAEGKLQPVERQLADAVTNEILAEKAGDVDRLIEEATGLDAQRFLRSVLLAQGQFAAFLKAKPNERAELLERITGTEIYSTLSQLAYTTYAERQTEMERLRTQLGALLVLADEERAALEKQQSAGAAETARLSAQAAAANQRLTAQRDLQKAQRELLGVEEQTQQLTQDVEKLGADRSAAQAAATACQAALDTAKRRRTERQPVWDKATQLGTQIGELEEKLRVGRDRYRALQADHRTAETAKEKAAQGLAELAQAAQALETWLKEQHADGLLAEALPGLRKGLSDWRAAFQALDQGRRNHREAATWRKKQVEGESKAAEFTAAAKAAAEKLSAARLVLERLNQQCDQQRKVVDHAQQAASLEDYRHALQPGEPCPLCGALEHPFAVHAPNFESQWQSARNLLLAIEKQRDESRQTEQSIARDMGQLELRVQTEQGNLREAMDRLAAIAAPADAELNALEKDARQWAVPVLEALGRWMEQAALARFTPAQATPEDAERAMAALDKRARLFAAKQIEAGGLRSQRDQMSANAALAAQDAEAKKQRLDEFGADMITLRGKADGLKELLRECLGELTLQEDRQRHDQDVSAAEDTLRQVETRGQELLTRLTESNTRIGELGKRRQLLESAVAGAAPVTAEALVEWERIAVEAGAQLASHQKAVGAVEERLRNDDVMRARRESGGAALKHAEAEAVRWGKLKELIGSADGSKFARFAQALTLRQLIGLANHHLQMLAPRYRLAPAPGDDLDLRIVDLYQAAVDRPMESLSGGESFLASLALALGLSELASRHHPIDSLFIDEGFGSLDSETLEVALSALENLRARGKSIGLISHVDLLKERLATQVRVSRTPGGTSRIDIVA